MKESEGRREKEKWGSYLLRKNSNVQSLTFMEVECQGWWLSWFGMPEDLLIHSAYVYVVVKLVEQRSRVLVAFNCVCPNVNSDTYQTAKPEAFSA